MQAETMTDEFDNIPELKKEYVPTRCTTCRTIDEMIEYMKELERQLKEFDELMLPVQKVKERERINTLKFFISRLEGMGK
jgi:hypothetical protein